MYLSRELYLEGVNRGGGGGESVPLIQAIIHIGKILFVLIRSHRCDVLSIT